MNILEAIEYYMEECGMSEEAALLMVDMDFDLFEADDENDL